MKKTILIYSPAKFAGEAWLPTLWCQAKSYYEKNGKNNDQWHWYPCYADIWPHDPAETKQIILQARPDIFAVSLYVWNASMALEMAQWVKQTFPHCVLISGGPQQHFRHDSSWFKKHPYLDCSLPGESYGELCFAELLDNFSDKIDFNLISDLRYPFGKDRMLCVSKKTLHDKTGFDYDWSSFAGQATAVEHYIDYAKKSQGMGCKFMAIVETTRGCPYGCTYCDWGGGINTKVIRKPDPAIYHDIDFLSSLDLTYLYIADANFGIFGDRDVAIMDKIAASRRHYRSDFRIGYGGFAKTKNRLPYIRQIVEIDIENQLSNQQEIKLSIQSLSDEVLENINRQNIPLDDQIKALKGLARKNKIPFYVEMILGLPGMDLDKFYFELTDLGRRHLAVQWYEWILLPETPAYDMSYREKFGIIAVEKKRGWMWPEPGASREIVIGGSGFTSTDYLEMLLAAGLYGAMVQCGVYKYSISRLRSSLGDIIKQFCRRYMDAHPDIMAEWHVRLRDSQALCELSIGNRKVAVLHYFIMLSYLAPQCFVPMLESVLQRAGVPKWVLWLDRMQHCHQANDTRSPDVILQQFSNFQKSGHILRKLDLNFFC